MSIWHAIYSKCPYKHGVEISAQLLGPFTMSVRIHWWRHADAYMCTVNTFGGGVCAQSHVTMSDELEMHR